jgi:hypothetical protein
MNWEEMPIIQDDPEYERKLKIVIDNLTEDEARSVLLRMVPYSRHQVAGAICDVKGWAHS